MDLILTNIYSNNAPKTGVLIKMVLRKCFQYRGLENKEELKDLI